MKFTPETLIQIYLDGSFTEEAQAEFNALMRRDPIFAEKVTQAVAERLGAVPDSTVETVSSSLDGKIGEIWNRNKLSPLARALKGALRMAVVLGVGAGLFLGGRSLWSRFNHPAAPGASLSANGMISKVNPAAGPGAGANPGENEKAAAGISTHGKTGPSEETQVFHESGETAGAKNNTRSGSLPPPKSSGNSASAEGAAPSAPSSTAPGSGTGPSGASLNTTGPGTTAEGNSLRVAIDMDQTQNVTVTVYDANGLPVRQLFRGVLTQGEHNVDWDGKDGSGNAVVPGAYTVILDMGGKKMSGTLEVLPNP